MSKSYPFDAATGLVRSWRLKDFLEQLDAWIDAEHRCKGQELAEELLDLGEG
jgi:hypothetical protein